ncbi:hypothetical protein BC830DRAFT_1095729, partial [Chytriomyces sp. MP71]
MADEGHLKDELAEVYHHIERNEYKGGANGRIDDMEVMPCTCKMDPGDDPQLACGDASDCINRALFLECSADDCPCGYYCQNRRFWNMQYAPIKVIKTELKGYGLKAMKHIKKGQFIIEYVGEVITQSMFLKRVREYSETGAKHFYFMSIKTDEVIDAYKKGNHARFMNHACFPNCELQKWVVGSQIRMGFFAIMDVAEGEELTFDYKFERYGAEPQICYCSHPSCKGIIGGQQKSVFSLEGQDDYDEEEEKLSAKPRRSKSLSDDEDYDSSQRVENQGLQTVEAVKSMVKLLLYSTSKPAKLIRLLHKLEATQNTAMQHKFLQYHGLAVLKSCLSHYCKSNVSICYQILRILKAFPKVTRNSILDSKIEDVVRKFVDPHNGAAASVVESAQELLDLWSTFSMVYRIPKKTMQELQQQSDVNGGIKRASNESSSYNSYSNYGNNSNSGGTTSSSAVFSAADLLQSSKRGKFDRNGSNHNDDSLNSRSLSTSSLASSGSNGAFNSASPRGYVPSPRDGSTGMVPSPLGLSSKMVESVLDALPKGWKSARNNEGRIYYYNMETKESRWDYPRDVNGSGDSHGVGGVGSGTGGDGSGFAPQEPKVRSSMIEGMSEAEIDAIVQRALAGNLATPDAVEAMKNLRAFISEIVVKTLSKHKSELGNEKFKKVARKITHQILEKEAKLQQASPSNVKPTEETKAKIKKFTKKCYESFLESEKKGGVKL